MEDKLYTELVEDLRNQLVDFYLKQFEDCDTRLSRHSASVRAAAIRRMPLYRLAQRIESIVDPEDVLDVEKALR